MLDIFCETRKDLREDHILASVFNKSDEKTLGVQEKKLYLCGVLFCDDQFVTIDELTNHISLVHEEKKLLTKNSTKKFFMCRICNYQFAKIEEFREHYSSVHEEKKPSQSSNDTNINPKNDKKSKEASEKLVVEPSLIPLHQKTVPLKLMDEMEKGKALKNVTKTYLKRGNTFSDTERSSLQKYQRLNQLSNENLYVDQLLAFYQKSSNDQTSDQTQKLSYENMLLMNAICRA